jgi:CRISPR-associated protein Cas1
LNPLHLFGYGVRIRTRNLRSRSELVVTQGREGPGEPRELVFHPRKFPYNSIIIDGHSGYITLQALHWLSRNKIPVSVINYDGTVISSILPPLPVKADLRAAQLKASTDPQKKYTIAKSLVQAKIARSLQLLECLAERYDIEKNIRLTKKEAQRLEHASTVDDIRSVEGRVARRYWEGYAKAIPECFDFQGRMTSSHQNNATDPINASLNYAYGFLEGECRKAINTVGLESAVGFLHEFSDYQTKQSLVYDLQEPFRWLADISIITTFESGTLDLPDFYFTGDDYNYQIEVEAKHRFVHLLRHVFNSRIKYKGRSCRWDTVIELKAAEIGRYLTGKSALLDLTEPTPDLRRTDSLDIRDRILALGQSEAEAMGVGRSTLHYLRRNAQDLASFTIYGKVRERLCSDP